MDEKRISAAWMVEERIELLKEEMEFEKEKLKALIQTMSYEDLEYLVDSHNDFEFPWVIVYANSELVKRENLKIIEEEVPY